jgi:hypothetical protein
MVAGLCRGHDAAFNQDVILQQPLEFVAVSRPWKSAK